MGTTGIRNSAQVIQHAALLLLQQVHPGWLLLPTFDGRCHCLAVGLALLCSRAVLFPSVFPIVSSLFAFLLPYRFHVACKTSGVLACIYCALVFIAANVAWPNHLLYLQ